MDTNESVEPIASEDDAERSNLSNISSEDELSSAVRKSLPSMNDTLNALYKSSHSKASNVSQ